jgi:hypothetical protein
VTMSGKSNVASDACVLVSRWRSCPLTRWICQPIDVSARSRSTSSQRSPSTSPRRRPSTRTRTCCAQGKDAARPEKHSDPNVAGTVVRWGSAATGKPSEWTVHDAYMALRAALSNAVRDETLSRNVAANVKMSVPRKRKVKPWTVDEAQTFLESARTRQDTLYPAYVLSGKRSSYSNAKGWSLPSGDVEPSSEAGPR